MNPNPGRRCPPPHPSARAGVTRRTERERGGRADRFSLPSHPAFARDAPLARRLAIDAAPVAFGFHCRLGRGLPGHPIETLSRRLGLCAFGPGGFLHPGPPPLGCEIRSRKRTTGRFSACIMAQSLPSEHPNPPIAYRPCAAWPAWQRRSATWFRFGKHRCWWRPCALPRRRPGGNAGGFIHLLRRFCAHR